MARKKKRVSALLRTRTNRPSLRERIKERIENTNKAGQRNPRPSRRPAADDGNPFEDSPTPKGGVSGRKKAKSKKKVTKKASGRSTKTASNAKKKAPARRKKKVSTRAAAAHKKAGKAASKKRVTKKKATKVRTKAK